MDRPDEGVAGSYGSSASPISPGDGGDGRDGGKSLQRVDSWDSGSVTSNSNGTGTVASGTVMLAVTPVWKLIVSVSIPSLFGQLLTGLAGLNEFSLLSYYTGREALALMATYVPLIQFLAVYPVTAMASSASQFVTRALGQNMVVMANVYLAHFFFVAICWSVICMLVTLPWLPTLNNLLGGADQDYDKAGGQPYLMTMLIGASLVTTFNQAVSPFLLAEGRSFLAMNREVFWAALRICLDSLLMVLVDIGHAAVPGTPFPTAEMQYVAIGYIVSGAAIAVWMILIVLRKSLLDIPLKGCLKFSIKRLFPLNPAIVLRIILFGAPEWLLTAQAPVVMFIVSIVLDATFTDVSILINHRIQNYIYYQMYILVGSFTTAFTEGFVGVLTYNLGVKKFRRIKDLFIQAFIWETAGTAVLAILVLAAAEPLAKFFCPKSLTDSDDLYQEILRLNTYALRMSAVIQPFMVGYHISSSAANSEGRIWTMVCLVCARFGPLIIMLVVTALRNGDEADFVMTLPLAESCPAIVGILLFAHYVLKYKYLSEFDVASEPSVLEEDGAYLDAADHADLELASKDGLAGDPNYVGVRASEDLDGGFAGGLSGGFASDFANGGGSGSARHSLEFASGSAADSERHHSASPPVYQGDIVLTKIPKDSKPAKGPAGPETLAVVGDTEDSVSPAPTRANIQSLMTLPQRDSDASRTGGGALSDATGLVEDSVLMSIMNDESMMEVSKAD